MAAVIPVVGTVVSFDDHVGLGLVRVADGREWSFHCTRLVDGSRTVASGATVIFEVVPGAPGRWEASALVKVV